jgi:hypothetical protein
MTLEEAITDVRSHIDDRQSRNWTDNQVRRALWRALSGCLSEYARAGGERFDVEAERTSDGENGVLLVEEAPILIRHVLLDEEWRTPIRAVDPSIRGTTDTTSRDLIIRYVPAPTLPQDDTDHLLGADEWPAMDGWICAKAAIYLGVSDNDDRPGLERAEARLRAEVLTSQRIPHAKPWPRGRVSRLRYLWTPGEKRLTLHRVAR